MKPIRTCIACGHTTRELEQHYLDAHYVKPKPWKIEKASKRNTYEGGSNYEQQTDVM